MWTSSACARRRRTTRLRPRYAQGLMRRPRSAAAGGRGDGGGSDDHLADTHERLSVLCHWLLIDRRQWLWPPCRRARLAPCSRAPRLLAEPPGNLGQSRAILGSLWRSLAISGILGSLGQSRTIYGNLGQSGTIYGNLGQSRAVSGKQPRRAGPSGRSSSAAAAEGPLGRLPRSPGPPQPFPGRRRPLQDPPTPLPWPPGPPRRAARRGAAARASARRGETRGTRRLSRVLSGALRYSCPGGERRVARDAYQGKGPSKAPRNFLDASGREAWRETPFRKARCRSGASAYASRFPSSQN